MVSADQFRTIATSFEGVESSPHFEKESFRIKKKIFATLDVRNHRATVKLTPIDQSVFCAFNKEIIFPVPGGWGKKGWTIADLKKLPKSMLKDLVQTAYNTVVAGK